MKAILRLSATALGLATGSAAIVAAALSAVGGEVLHPSLWLGPIGIAAVAWVLVLRQLSRPEPMPVPPPWRDRIDDTELRGWPRVPVAAEPAREVEPGRLPFGMCAYPGYPTPSAPWFPDAEGEVVR